VRSRQKDNLVQRAGSKMQVRLANVFVFGCLLSFSHSAFAQFTTAPCRATGYSAETCLVKDFKKVEEFYADDFTNLRELAKKHPNLPWLAVLDSSNSLISDLTDGADTIPSSASARYSELIQKLKVSSNNISDLLEATQIYLEANPTQKFYLSNPDPKIMQKFLAGIGGKQNVADTPAKVEIRKCAPNESKYVAIMEDKRRCGGRDVESLAGLNLYTALAEIASCDRYNVDQIGVVQTVMYRSLSVDKPCVVSLKGASANIGAGHIDIKSNGEVKSVNWTSGYDLFDKKNDLAFWRSQLVPQVEELLATKATSTTGTSAAPKSAGTSN
jgi:hypothetical protein